MSSQTRWIDVSAATGMQTLEVYRTETTADGRLQVDHALTAASHFKAAGKAVLDVVDPTNHIRESMRELESTPHRNRGEAWGIFSLGAVVIWPFQEVFDLGFRSVDAVTHASYAIKHAAEGALGVFTR